MELSTLHTESDVVEMSVTAPLFDETPLPRHALPGEPFYRLWEYEGGRIYFIHFILCYIIYSLRCSIVLSDYLQI